MKKPFRASRGSGVFVLLFMIAMGAVFTYWRLGGGQAPGEYEVRKGNYRIEDGRYEEAITDFGLALEKNPQSARAHQGLAVTYLQMGRMEDAVAEFTTAIDADPEYAVALADRGITYDRMGKHEEALRDYRKALEMDPLLEKGPGWIWRFLHNVSEKPPDIGARADYLETELAKLPAERLLAVPGKDSEQRMYTQ
jgi:tetratricopeptide (TPR) repeat protein